MDPQPSCYIVELSVDPGGARRGDVFVYSRVEHVRRIVEQEFQSPDPRRVELANGLLESGERTLVWPVQHGVLGDPVDLRNFVKWKQDHFDIDWAGLEANIPKLVGPLLHAGETVILEDLDELTDPIGSYLALSLGEELEYGYSDLEGGEEPPADWVDPDPPRT